MLRHRRHIRIIGIFIQLPAGIQYDKFIIRQHLHGKKLCAGISKGSDTAVNDLFHHRPADHMPVQSSLKGQIENIPLLPGRRYDIIPPFNTSA